MISLNKKAKLVIAIIAIIIVAILISSKIITEKRNSDLYNEAINYFADGNIELTRERLKSIEDPIYKDKQQLLDLCRSVQYYRNGLYFSAWCYVSLNFEYLNEEEIKRVSDYEEKVKQAYFDEIDEQERIAEANYQARVAEGFPFVGMRESDIYKNNNGEYDIRKVVYTHFNREHPNMHVYYYLRYGSNRIFYVVKCDGGVVLYIENYYERNKYFDYSKRGTTHPDDDPYGAGGYSNAEDFYDDHYDDFFDYEEAEAYYNEYSD